MTSKEEFIKNLMKGIDAQMRLKEWQRKKRIEQMRHDESDIASIFARRHNRLVKNWGAY
jgi:DNA replication initiation complex subunit (GINS family)